MSLRILALAALLPLSLGAQEVAAGYSHFLIRPGQGTAQRMDGAFLTGRLLCPATRWSLELDLRRETGSDAEGVDYTHTALSAGPRFTQPLGPHLEAFGHLLLGEGRLDARLAGLEARKTSFLVVPGVGLDLKLSAHWLLRGQADLVRAHYGADSKWNPRLALGVGYRFGRVETRIEPRP